MASTYTDAQQLWPVSGSPNCSSIFGTPIIANTTNSRVCGLQTNRTIAERCCGSAEIHEYQCWLYCESTEWTRDWAQCVAGNSTSPTAWGPFCQGGLASNNTESLTSSGFRSSAPKYSWAIFSLVLAFLFVVPAQAIIIPSLDDGLTKRQSDGGCTLTIDRNYTSLKHSSKIVSSTYDCTNTAGNLCAFDLPIDTPLTENNRTLNDTSAAEPEFDAFFDVVSNATNGRMFPAMSSVSLTRGVVASAGQTFRMGWTPISFCVNGTVTGCSDNLEAATDGSYFEACGPTFVDNGDEDSPVQGIINPVLT